MTTPRPDGLVHQVRYVSNLGRGTRAIVVACGRPQPHYSTGDRLTGATLWPTEVTCSSSTQGDSVPSCRDNPVPWSETPDLTPKKK